MALCDDDSQRRLIIDWMAYAECAKQAIPMVTYMGPYLFIDDSRFATASDNTALSVTAGSTVYAIKKGDL